MKHTPFYNNHIALKAKMVPFAGYEMPVYYTGINDEHLCVRNHVGLFDISHMGEFIVKGENALPLLQYITTNDVEKLENNQVQYSMLTNEQGNILDDILVYCIEKNNIYMLVVNASNIDKDWQWITLHNQSFNAHLENISDHCAMLAVQGKNALRLIQEIAGNSWDIINMPYYTFKKNTFLNIEDVLISATGYTGSGGVEIYIKNQNEHVQKIWNAIVEIGKKYNLKPAGLGARDTLRLEMGYCLYGNDIDETTNPLESNLKWAVKFRKNFIGKNVLEKIQTEGISRRRIGFILNERGIPRAHCLIKDHEMNTIGMVSSGTFSPSLQQGIGMGFVNIKYANINTRIFIEIKDKNIAANIVNLPFLSITI